MTRTSRSNTPRSLAPEAKSLLPRSLETLDRPYDIYFMLTYYSRLTFPFEL